MTLSLAGAEFTARIIDDGVPFDPLSAPAQDIDAPMEKRKVGGLGIFLVRKLMDSVEHRRDEGKNIMTVKKTIGRVDTAR